MTDAPTLTDLPTADVAILPPDDLSDKNAMLQLVHGLIETFAISGSNDIVISEQSIALKKEFYHKEVAVAIRTEMQYVIDKNNFDFNRRKMLRILKDKITELIEYVTQDISAERLIWRIQNQS